MHMHMQMCTHTHTHTHIHANCRPLEAQAQQEQPSAATSLDGASEETSMSMSPEIPSQRRSDHFQFQPCAKAPCEWGMRLHRREVCAQADRKVRSMGLGLWFPACPVKPPVR